MRDFDISMVMDHHAEDIMKARGREFAESVIEIGVKEPTLERAAWVAGYLAALNAMGLITHSIYKSGMDLCYEAVLDEMLKTVPKFGPPDGGRP